VKLPPDRDYGQHRLTGAHTRRHRVPGRRRAGSVPRRGSDAGREAQPVRGARRAPPNRASRRCRRRARSQAHRAPQTATALAHLGPGPRDGTARRVTVASGVPVYSVIRAAAGNAAATRTPAGCSANTSFAAPASATEPRATSTPSPTSSTDALDQPSAGRHHHKHSTERRVDP
jgi:hypothetical protein